MQRQIYDSNPSDPLSSLVLLRSNGISLTLITVGAEVSISKNLWEV